MIEIENLSFAYHPREIVIDNVSLKVEKGSVYGFLGPNGSGKTTIIRLILNLLKHKTGRILVDGVKVGPDSLDVFRRIGSMIESPSLYNHLSGRANLEIFAMYYSVDKERIEKVLEIVGLTQAASRTVKRYSLGMKQRLGIAICLLHDPDLLILDEPLNGLDPHGIAEIRQLLIRLSREEGKTVFISSHLLSEIESTCDHIGIISKGRLLFEGRIDTLKKAQTGTLTYLLETRDPQHTIASLGKWTNIRSQLRDQLIQIEFDDLEQVPVVVRDLVADGVEVFNFQRRDNNLEDLFLELTK